MATHVRHRKVTELFYAQPKPSISPRWPVISQCLQPLEKRFFKTTFRATRAVSALLAAHRSSLHASRMYDARGDRQQHAGSFALLYCTYHSISAHETHAEMATHCSLIYDVSSLSAFAER